MSVVVPMEHDPHVGVQSLLPWYVRGQLDDDEMREVQAHLMQCAACRAELEAERPLQAMLSVSAAGTEPSGLSDVEAGLAALQARLAPRAVAPALPARLPGWLGWVLGLQGAAIAALLVLLVLPPGQPAPAYQGLAASAPRADAEALIMFRPDASEQRIRTLLQAHGASILGGPTESGAYRLRLAGGEAALRALRADPVVTLAESLAPGGAR